MCKQILLLLPPDADVAVAVGLARFHGLAPGGPRRTGVPKVDSTLRVFDSSMSWCECDSPIGALWRDAPTLADLERESRTGKAARWSDEHRRRWIANEWARVRRRAELDLTEEGFADLVRWCDLAIDAAADPRIGRIGVLADRFDGDARCWAAPVTIRPILDELAGIAWRTPTWIVPDGA